MNETGNNDAIERERLARRADVERDRLLRVLDALFGRHPVEHAEKRAKQIGIPILLVAVAGTTLGLVLSYRKHRKKIFQDYRRMPAHLEIARGVIVSVATFVVGAFAKKYAKQLIRLPQ